MKWPQFELWRLFAAMTLIAVALGLVRLVWRTAGSDVYGLLAVLCFGAGIGLPFRRPILGMAVAFVLGIIAVVCFLASRALE